MNKIIVKISSISNVVFLGLTYLIFPFQLGYVFGILNGFFGIDKENWIWPLVILYSLLMLPSFQITKLVLNKINKNKEKF
jgi:hypothetical protein